MANSELKTVSEKTVVRSADISNENRPKEMFASSHKKEGIILNYTEIILPLQTDTCDTIVLRNEVEIKARVLEITSGRVRYKHCDNPNGPTYTIAVNEVALIKYKNGTKDEFKKEVLQAPTAYSPEKLIERKANAALILGILAFPFTFFYIGGIVCAILAIVNGRAAQKMMKSDPSLFNKSHYSTAKTGVILGIVYLSLLALILIAFFVALVILLAMI